MTEQYPRLRYIRRVEKVDMIAITVRIPVLLDNAIELKCKELGMAKARYVEGALRWFSTEHDKQESHRDSRK
jgi:hypothetical protein